jgi:hypothetical protein
MTLNLRAVVTLEILQAHFRDHGRLPPQHKVALRLGLSPSSTDIVRAAYGHLEAAGFIRRLSHGWSRIKLVDTEDQDAADYARRANTETRRAQYLEIVQGLQISPPLAITSKLRGLKPLHNHTKAYWLLGFPPSMTGSAA